MLSIVWLDIFRSLWIMLETTFFERRQHRPSSSSIRTQQSRSRSVTTSIPGIVHGEFYRGTTTTAAGVAAVSVGPGAAGPAVGPPCCGMSNHSPPDTTITTTHSMLLLLLLLMMCATMVS